MRRAVYAIVVLLVAALAGITLVGRLTADRPLRLTANAKQICVYSRNRIDTLETFEQATGTTINCAVIFNDVARTWTDLENLWFVDPGSGQADLDWASWVRQDKSRRTLILTQSLVPEQVPANWLELAASGAYDRYAVTLAGRLVKAGLGSVVIRLGHEANGDWYTDNIGTSAADHAHWIEAWRRFALAMKSVAGAHFVFDWTVNPAYRPVPFADYYPGDDVVDAIGVDVYDTLPSGQTAQPARWQAQWARAYGVGALVDFAAAHRKPLSIPEWGLQSGSYGAGDDPVFVDRIAALVHSGTVMYQAYFDSDTGDTVPLQQAPNSLARWRADFATR